MKSWLQDNDIETYSTNLEIFEFSIKLLIN